MRTSVCSVAASPFCGSCCRKSAAGSARCQADSDNLPSRMMRWSGSRRAALNVRVDDETVWALAGAAAAAKNAARRIRTVIRIEPDDRRKQHDSSGQPIVRIFILTFVQAKKVERRVGAPFHVLGDPCLYKSIEDTIVADLLATPTFN